MFLYRAISVFMHPWQEGLIETTSRNLLPGIFFRSNL